MKNKVIIRESILFLVGIFLIIGVSANGLVETNTALLKVSIKQNEVIQKTFSIFSDEGGPVSLRLINVEGISIEQNSFVLNSGEFVSVNLSFDSKNLIPGIYAGYIEITSKKGVSNLPIILEVESKDVLFDGDLEVPPVYSEVSPGDKLVVKIQVFDLTFGSTGLSPASIDLEYFIYKDDGTLILSEKETLVVNHELSLTKSISLPENLKPGNYFVGTKTVYGTSVGTSTGLFEVSSKSSKFFNLINLDAGLGILMVIFVLIFGGVFLFIYLLKDRDKLMMEFRRCNSQELERQEQFLIEQQKFLLGTRRFSDGDIQRKVDEKLGELRELNKKREEDVIKIIKRQKGVNRKKFMEEKIKDWKTKGYNTILLKSKLKDIRPSEMKELLAKWRAKGYK